MPGLSMTSYLDKALAKLPVVGFSIEDDLPPTREDSMWKDIALEYKLEVLELFALKNRRCQGTPFLSPYIVSISV